MRLLLPKLRGALRHCLDPLVVLHQSDFVNIALRERHYRSNKHPLLGLLCKLYVLCLCRRQRHAVLCATRRVHHYCVPQHHRNNTRNRIPVCLIAGIIGICVDRQRQLLPIRERYPQIPRRIEVGNDLRGCLCLSQAGIIGICVDRQRQLLPVRARYPQIPRRIEVGNDLRGCLPILLARIV